MTSDLDVQIRLSEVLARWYAHGIITITGTYSAADHTVVMRHMRVLPTDPRFAGAVQTRLRSLSWISRVSLQLDKARTQRLNMIRGRLAPYLNVRGLRSSILTILNRLDQLTDTQLDQIHADLHVE
ncbi:MAG: hypothetical protein WC544_01030 [Patescibacteria group bacterium]